MDHIPTVEFAYEPTVELATPADGDLDHVDNTPNDHVDNNPDNHVEYEGPRYRGIVQSVRDKGRYGLIQVADQEDLVMFTRDYVIDSTGLWQGDHVEFSLMPHQSGQNRAKDVVITERAHNQRKVHNPNVVSSRYRGSAPVSSEESFPCKFCGQRFSKEPILEQHVISKHPGAEEYLKMKEEEANSEGPPSTSTSVAMTAEAIKNLALNLADVDGKAALLAWLEGIKLEEHTEKLLQLGIDTLDLVKAMSEEKQKEVLDALKLPLGPKKRFLRAIAILNEPPGEAAEPTELNKPHPTEGQ